MNASNILAQADSLFALGEIENAGKYLEEKSKEALAESEDAAALSILNELTGYYRHSGRMKDAWSTAEIMLELIERLNLWESLDGATALLNIATIYKETHAYQKAMSLYCEVEKIYQQNELCDVRYLGLLNNMCVTSLMMEDYRKAWEYGNRALQVLEKLDSASEHYERETKIVMENIEMAKKLLANA